VTTEIRAMLSVYSQVITIGAMLIGIVSLEINIRIDSPNGPTTQPILGGWR